MKQQHDSNASFVIIVARGRVHTPMRYYGECTHTQIHTSTDKNNFLSISWTSAQALSPHVFTVNELFSHAQGDFFVPKWSDTSIVPPFAFVKGLCSNEQHGTQSVSWRFCFSLSLSLAMQRVHGSEPCRAKVTSNVAIRCTLPRQRHQTPHCAEHRKTGEREKKIQKK